VRIRPSAAHPRSGADSADPFVQRLRRQRRRRWRVAGAVLALAALAGVVVWTVFGSGVLAVDRIEVRGAELLSDATVRRAVDVPVGTPLARVDTAAARARVEDLVEVAEVEVTRSWPDALVVVVRERQAVAVVEVGGRVRGMDDTGVVFRDFARRPRELPVVRVGGRVRDEALVEAARVLDALPALLDGAVSHVAVRTVDDITVVLQDGRRVVWGSAEESGNKGAVLQVLLDQPATDPPVREYDVSVPGQPTTRS